ncbi:uncharacterized protein BX663DRAFT_556703 [Cokeromyces recurvatus]|uniref:uncharacterized protein n=1 Tax=Cokeromyces recurvatus TaxID=90255 RepID=UPI00221E539C|nr:uncharacterized protein BX663DRAFT_556703 [Cokeromyces recurvatus]KAI7897466.1 hypothetical protein BX663DRAFT_556703 [Cokeromyces recurvatus]
MKIAGLIRQSGDLSNVPYAEPSYWMGFKALITSTESHTNFRKAIRAIYDEIKPEAILSEDSGAYPTKELYAKLGEEGVLASQIGPGPWLKGLKLPGAGWNPGFADGISSGYSIAITEPYAGSDVARIRTTATRPLMYLLNILGKEGKGFRYHVNFNHERWYICCAVIGASRAVVEVVLNGLITKHHYQMCNMSYMEQSVKLAGRAITKTGMGRMIEPSKEQEIMADLGIRQAMKAFPTGAKL